MTGARSWSCLLRRPARKGAAQGPQRRISRRLWVIKVRISKSLGGAGSPKCTEVKGRAEIIKGSRGTIAAGRTSDMYRCTTRLTRSEVRSLAMQVLAGLLGGQVCSATGELVCGVRNHFRFRFLRMAAPLPARPSPHNNILGPAWTRLVSTRCHTLGAPYPNPDHSQCHGLPSQIILLLLSAIPQFSSSPDFFSSSSVSLISHDLIFSASR